MPLMVDIRRAVVFGGERGEGLQKTQKLALFADELLVVCESRPTQTHLALPAGRQSELNELLELPTPRTVPVHPVAAAEADLETLIAGANFVTSDLVDRALNERIAQIAAKHGVLCNIIDTKDLCNVWFMSLIQTDHLLAGFSSRAKATFYLTRLRARLEPRFRRWETEAAFVAAVRERLQPSVRHEGLAALWKSPLVRLVLALAGRDPALRLVEPRIARINKTIKETSS